MWIHFKHPGFKDQWTDTSDTEGWAGAQPKLLSLPELCRSLAECWESLTAYCVDLALYRAQHPDRFCARVCVCCLGFAIVGHYVPGIMIAYIIVASVLLWPLVVYHELIQKMYNRIEPVLMKLDYSMRGGMLGRGHEQRRVRKEKTDGNEPTAETDSDSEGELSNYCTKVDVKRTALALSITDSELSDEEASILESEGFTLSRGSTPPPPADHSQEDFDLQNNPEDSPHCRAKGQQSGYGAHGGRGAPGTPGGRAASTAEVLAAGRHGEMPPAPALRFDDTHFNEHDSGGTAASTAPPLPRRPPVAIQELGEAMAKEILRFAEPRGTQAQSPDVKEHSWEIAGSGSGTAAMCCAAAAARNIAGVGIGGEASIGAWHAEEGSGAKSPGDVVPEILTAMRGGDSPAVAARAGEETGAGAGAGGNSAAMGGGAESAGHAALPESSRGREGGEAVAGVPGGTAGVGGRANVGASRGGSDEADTMATADTTVVPLSTLADAEGDDFEVVDESEVERLGAEMRSSGIGVEETGSTGFFSGFLGQ
ncbi:reticulophagy regulator 2-like [Lethenteron reissneri]|uniref:reticulophagy regulator 2-like n=1 Tax=Lethenteron reissneri TaxID=7753 RepID=UPI002AB6A5B8|nr:reticulophagy regulator 2-like [Lethenteron reissneri]